MATVRERSVTKNKAVSAGLLSPKPRSLKIAERGIRTGQDFANLMSALMSDIIDGCVAPQVGNATCNAGGKLLKIVEMQFKYGTTTEPGKKPKTLTLAIGGASE